MSALSTPTPRTGGLAVLVALTLAAAATPAAGQAAPGTDIVLLPLDAPPEGAWSVGAPVRVTERPGYDNQPSFTPDGAALLFTSIRSEAQADIYRFDLIARTETQLTRTEEAEYSATVMPEGDAFSVIRVEADGTQRLWAFDLDGTNPRLLLPEIAPVGYHAWSVNRALALFILGDPPTLQIVPPGADRGRQMAENIGRSLHAIPGEPAFSFLQNGEGGATIQAIDPARGRTRQLAPALEGSQDYTWAPRSTLLMADDTGLYRWPTGRRPEARWEPVTGLPEGLGRITRMAVSPDGRWLAVVVDEAG
jgi:dipeptidyl aminopeptidase/acylaminoacyl peptidase